MFAWSYSTYYNFIGCRWAIISERAAESRSNTFSRRHIPAWYTKMAAVTWPGDADLRQLQWVYSCHLGIVHIVGPMVSNYCEDGPFKSPSIVHQTIIEENLIYPCSITTCTIYLLFIKPLLECCSHNFQIVVENMSTVKHVLSSQCQCPPVRAPPLLKIVC